MNRTFTKLFIIGLLLFNISCSTYKQVPYFQDLNRATAITEEIKNYSPLTIQTGDILGISITSLNPESSAIFNYNLSRINGVNSDPNPTNAVVGYLVDQKGNILLPLLGSMKVAGYTTADLRDQLSRNVAAYVKEPVVNIRILNFKVSVIGDVLRPDVYSFQNERVTITEALGHAGDLNITAKRTNVLIIREKDGKREFITFDLTSKKIFDSPYYYLKNNDVIYVEPDRTKYAQVDRGYRAATLIIATLSLVAIVVSTILVHK